MTYNHLEDPNARAHWICIKWLISNVHLTPAHEKCITRIIHALGVRPDHKTPIHITTLEEEMLEKISYAAAVGYDRPPYMIAGPL